MKHIADFYVQNSRATWFVDRWGAEWGKPASQCKACMKGYNGTPIEDEEDTPDTLETVGRAKGLTGGVEYTDEDDAFSQPTFGKDWRPLGPPEPKPERHYVEVTDEEIAMLNDPDWRQRT